MRNPFRKRFIAVLVGQETGEVQPLSFVTFRSREKAEAWVEKMNNPRIQSPTLVNLMNGTVIEPIVLVRYEVRER